MKLTEKHIIYGILAFLALIIIYNIFKDDEMPDNVKPSNTAAAANELAQFIKPTKTGRVTSKVGIRIHPITGAKKFHNGTDIAAPIGTPIFAIASGKVSKVYYNPLGGNQIIITHDNGYTSGCAHCQKVIKENGQRVNAGDIIAYIGNTGASTGAHLHFTLKDKAGNYIDISKMYNA